MKKKWDYVVWAFIGLVILNFLVQKYDYKIDMTQNKRFTLSKASIKVVKNLDKPVQVLVFLKGDFPSYFQRLANETHNLLEDFKQENPLIDYAFINPLEKDEQYLKNLVNKGLQASQISLQKNGKIDQALIFPWAIIKQGEQEIVVPLLVDSYTQNIDNQIEKSIENLEYTFANGFNKIGQTKNKKIAILKGNGELDDLYIADFLKSLHQKYLLAPYTLDSVATNAKKTLLDLQNYDMAIVAKPTEKFDEQEKFVLDQYLMNGGRLLLLTDVVKAHKDTLMYQGKTYALNAELNLTDMLFSYGIRINPVLVKDLIAAPVVLKTGQIGNRPQLKQFPWFYSPLAQPNKQHPIGKNLEMILTDFVSPIQILKNKTRKTILLSSSPKTQLVGVPTEINFDEIGKKPDINQYNAGTQIFGVLLEGYFKSAYNHRVKPIKISHAKDSTTNGAMIVFSDGDIIKNQVDKNQPLPLGFDKWSKLKYDNKQFLRNAVDYLLDKSGVISLKNKIVKLNFLDDNKMIAELSFWQWLNLILPLLIISLGGLAFNYWRKKKYSRKFL